MKIKMSEISKRIVPVGDMDIVNKIRKDLDIPEEKLSDYATLVMSLMGMNSGYGECLKASAEISRNCRVWNTFGDGTGDYDVWMKFFIYDGSTGKAAHIGVYLSDLWMVGSEDTDVLKSRMYIREFKEVF